MPKVFLLLAVFVCATFGRVEFLTRLGISSARVFSSSHCNFSVHNSGGHKYVHVCRRVIGLSGMFLDTDPVVLFHVVTTPHSFSLGFRSFASSVVRDFAEWRCIWSHHKRSPRTQQDRKTHHSLLVFYDVILVFFSLFVCRAHKSSTPTSCESDSNTLS